MDKNLKLAIEYIKNKKPIIVPTDTVYGLVCRYDSKSAVEKIYKLKKRTRKKPLILLGYNWKVLKKFVLVNNNRSVPGLIKQWPGPLTLVLPASKNVPKYLNSGYKTIGVRVPNNMFLLKLLKSCPGKVLASTSANISGRILVNEIKKKVKLFIKAKKGEMSLEPSQIIEIKEHKTKILR